MLLWEFDKEGIEAVCAFAPDLAVVRVDDGLRDGETQTEAAVAAARVVEAIEALEDVFTVFGGKGRAGVGDAEADMMTLTGERDADGTGRSGIFLRVVKQNFRHLAELRGVAGDGQIRGNVSFQCELLLEKHSLKGERGVGAELDRKSVV